MKVLRYPGANPEETASANEVDVMKGKEEKKEEERRAAQSDLAALKLPLILPQVLASLTYDELGCLAALWTDVWRYSEVQVASKLGLKEGKVRVAKWRALRRYRCGDETGFCARKPGCAHAKGQAIWEEVICFPSN
jgi:hypothetical protein